MAVLTFLFTDYHYRQWIIGHKTKQITNGLHSLQKMASLRHYDVATLCDDIYQLSTLRFTLINSQGKVVCDRLHGEEQMDNHLTRPELKGVKDGEIRFHQRKSTTSSDESLYGAIKLQLADTSYYLRAAISLEHFDSTVGKVWKYILFLLLPALFLVSAILLWRLYLIDQKQQVAHQKLKGDLVANISHEVRTPLTSINGYLQLLKSEVGATSDSQRDYLERMELGVKQLSNLFSDVLELSLLENEMPLDEELLNSRDLINGIIRKLQSVYRDKLLHFSIEVEDFDFFADGKLIEMVFKNIVDNACKYSRVEGEIRVIFKRDVDTCRFICRDKGKGIPSHLENRIFERFYRGERDPSITGTGLGLSIAKHAVERHGGRVWYASVENQGTSFFVDLPYRQHS